MPADLPHANHPQLVAVTARYNAQAEQLRRTSLVVLQTGQALADVKGRSTQGLAACMASLASIKGLLESSIALQRQHCSSVSGALDSSSNSTSTALSGPSGDRPEAADAAAATAVSQQVGALQQVLPRLQDLLDQHRQQVELEQRSAAAGVTAVPHSITRRGSLVGVLQLQSQASGECAKGDATKPLMVYVQKVRRPAGRGMRATCIL